MKLKTLAAAVAILCSANAFAGIATDDNAEVWAMVWDEAKGTYALDLGITMNDLMNTTSSMTLGTVAGSSNWSAFVAKDGNLDDFQPFEGTRWGLFATDEDGLSFFPGTLNYLTTTTGSTPISINNEAAEAIIRSMGSIGGFAGDLNQGGLINNPALQGDAFNEVGSRAHFIEFPFTGTSGVFAGNAIGASSALFTCSVTSFDTSEAAACMKTGPTVSFDGTTFSATVTAVPEPGTYALMLAGLVAVGFMARRR